MKKIHFTVVPREEKEIIVFYDLLCQVIIIIILRVLALLVTT